MLPKELINVFLADRNHGTVSYTRKLNILVLHADLFHGSTCGDLPDAGEGGPNFLTIQGLRGWGVEGVGGKDPPVDGAGQSRGSEGLSGLAQGYTKLHSA